MIWKIFEQYESYYIYLTIMQSSLSALKDSKTVTEQMNYNMKIKLWLKYHAKVLLTFIVQWNLDQSQSPSLDFFKQKYAVIVLLTLKSPPHLEINYFFSKHLI